MYEHTTKKLASLAEGCEEGSVEISFPAFVEYVTIGLCTPNADFNPRTPKVKTCK